MDETRLPEDDYRAGPNGSPLQAGALPLRRVADRVEILLITSLTSAYWGIPKGWPHRGEALRDAAHREAAEEAGLRGSIDATPFALFHYEKAATATKPGGRDIAAFVMRVDGMAADWPERHRRQRAWFGLQEAAARVKSPQLAAILASLPDDIA